MLDVNIETTGTMTATTRDAIENNIGTITSTPYGSAPFARNIGVKNYPPSDLSEISKNKYITEIITQAARYEDRAKIKSVNINAKGEMEVVLSG